ncbi:MAG: STT3 domain-containing protein [Nanoarchaeota archaeon]
MLKYVNKKCGGSNKIFFGSANTKKRCIFDVVIILIAISFILFTRIQSIDKVIYEDKIIFTSYDSYYQARLIQNTVHNFPKRMWFDPYSLYPFGQPVLFGPLYDLIVAFTAIVIGLGSPTPFLIEITTAAFPMLLTMLSVSLVYFISKVAINRMAAMISVIAFAVMDGEFLFRSMFGNADHHMAELLFSLLFVLFFVLSLKRKKLVYSLLAGLALGCYFLVWYGAIIFCLIIFIYLIFIYRKHNPKKYLRDISITMAFPLLFFLLFAWSYSPYVASHEIFLLSFTIPILAALFLDKVKINYKKMFVWCLGIFAFLLVCFKFKILSAINFLKSVLIQKKIVSEMYSVWDINYFPWHFYLLIMICLICLLLLFYKENKKDTSIFIGIWSSIIILLSIIQIRFSYYLPANIGVLLGYGATKCETKKRMFVYIAIILLILLSISIVTYNNAKNFNPDLKEIYLASEWMDGNTPELELDYNAYSKRAKLTKDYYVYNNSLVCEEDKEICYKNERGCLSQQAYQLINPNKKVMNKSCKSLYEGYFTYDPYNYSGSDYSIMASYPYGHMITYMAKRIPVTNGFLFPIGLDNSEMFLISQEKDTGEDILNIFNSKYIIIDDYSINAIEYMADRLDNKKNYVEEIELPDKKQRIYKLGYYNSISVKLYLYDGEEYTPKESYVLVNNKIRKFSSYKSALDYSKNHNESLIVGIDPYESPIPFKKINDFELVYESDRAVAKNSAGEIKKVKIFQYRSNAALVN